MVKNIYWLGGKKDGANLRCYLAEQYGLTFKAKDINDAVIAIATNRAYHPIRSMLKHLPKWDGKPRVETLLIDYLGADDTAYTREVTRKTLVAAISRVKLVETKFDNMLVLVGPQGIGKSTLCKKLGGKWHTDSLTFSDIKREKTAFEKLRGMWIVEFGELSGLNKTDAELVKNFISATKDDYREAYGAHVKTFKRQNIFIGTTNAKNGFLTDTTGNRRFWPVDVAGTGEGGKTPFDLTSEEVDQIWAEALYYFENGETLILSQDIAKIAEQQQRQALVQDDSIARLEMYLNLPLPLNWYEWNPVERVAYINWQLDGSVPETTQSNKNSYSNFFDLLFSEADYETVKREKVCRTEIFVECFGGKRTEINRNGNTQRIDLLMQQLDNFEYTDKKILIPEYGKVYCYKRVDK